MNKDELIKTLQTLQSLELSELALADFYKECAGAWPEDKEFWEGMQASEIKHSGYIKRMAKILTDNPESFEVGPGFKSGEAEQMIEGTKYYHDKLKNGEFNKMRIFEISKKLEESIIERNYSTVVKSKNEEYRKLLTRIMGDTTVHKAMLNERIRGG